jgi:transketolase
MDKDEKLIYVLTGDGELQEGQIWEAMMFAAHQKIDNIIVTVDWNGQQIDGPNDDVVSLGDLEAKWTAFGWEVLIMEGNDIDQVIKGLQKAKQLTGKSKPVVILMKTEMGYGVDFMQGTHHWHGKAPNDEQKDIALSQLEETIGDYTI